MAIYRLLPEIPLFPSPEEAEPDGLLAVGGDLSVERLLEAYRLGIFPWYEEGQPLLWWSPDPRLILEPDELKISRSLKKILGKQMFEIRMDTAFSKVIHACADVRVLQGKGTWITSDILDAYIRLFELGYAHSVESWSDGELVGGLYGISLGRCFFGESMFSKKSNASKVALAALSEQMKQWGVNLIDCQVSTQHLIRMGAKEISRKEFLKRLKENLKYPTLKGRWNQI